MTRVLSICIVLIAAIVFFSSCERKRGDATACIDTGSSSLKAGTEIKFMNCSKNYDYTKWIVTDSANNVLFTEITDTLKHFRYTFPNPNHRYNVILNIWQLDSVSHSTTTKTFTAAIP